MSLVLEIEFLSGVSFAAIGPDSGMPDWPPQPDRIFSALVAAWAARGQNGQEAEALEWLEKLQPPLLTAPAAEPRTSATVFVPPNDPRSDRQKNAKGVLPGLRSRQARRFPAARLHGGANPRDRAVCLYWPNAEPEARTLAALERLAHDTAYVGHSASLTRCRFLLEPGGPDQGNANVPKRRIYKGRFAELRRGFEAGRRPLSGAPYSAPTKTAAAPANVFGDRWLIFEDVDRKLPDLRACAFVAKTLRDALLSGYSRIGLADEIPEAVSGHGLDRMPSAAPHIAIVPLAFTGFPHADGNVMGLALVPPRSSSIISDENFRKALRAIAPVDDNYERRILALKTKEGTPHDQAFSVALSPTFEAPKRSLDPTLYVNRARTFATVTPIVLDRHLKKKGEARQEEIKAQIVVACRNIGLPEPEEVVADKHSAFEGVPSAYPSGKSPSWTRWRLPRSIANRQLTHAVIRFAAPVDGPVLLGAGRFVGLGLCRPLDPEGR